MLFLTIWIWSYIITILFVLRDCYANPGRMYLDVFVTMACILAIPGVAVYIILVALYNKLFVRKVGSENEELWLKVEELHDLLQILRGKF